MKKTLISMVLALAMVFSLVLVAAPAAQAAAHTDHCVCGGKAVGVGDHTTCTTLTGWTAINTEDEMISAAANGGNYYLNADITMTFDSTVVARAEVAKGKTLNLCLNGHTLSGGDAARVIFTVRVDQDYSTLNITDCQGGGKIVDGFAAYAGGSIVNNGILNLYAGEISGGAANTNGGNVHNKNKNAVFNMYGGVIKDGSAGQVTADTDPEFVPVNKGHGGNVFIEFGIMNMYGGEITGGTGVYGGNVSVQGTLNAADGKIANGSGIMGKSIYVSITGQLNARGADLDDIKATGVDAKVTIERVKGTTTVSISGDATLDTANLASGITQTEEDGITTFVNTSATPECTNHTFGEWVQTTAPTYSSTGEQRRECSVCGYAEFQTLEKLPRPNLPTEPEATEPGATTPSDTNNETPDNTGIIIAVVAVVVVAAVVVAVVVIRKKK